MNAMFLRLACEPMGQPGMCCRAALGCFSRSWQPTDTAARHLCILRHMLTGGRRATETGFTSRTTQPIPKACLAARPADSMSALRRLAAAGSNLRVLGRTADAILPWRPHRVLNSEAAAPASGVKQAGPTWKLTQFDPIVAIEVGICVQSARKPTGRGRRAEETQASVEGAVERSWSD